MRFDLRFPTGPEPSKPLIGSCNSALIGLGQSMRCRLASCACAAIRLDLKNPMVPSVPGYSQSAASYTSTTTAGGVTLKSQQRLHRKRGASGSATLTLIQQSTLMHNRKSDFIKNNQAARENSDLDQVMCRFKSKCAVLHFYINIYSPLQPSLNKQ